MTDTLTPFPVNATAGNAASWQMALAAYETSSADLRAILDVKAIAEREEIDCRAAGKPSAFADDIHAHIDAFSNRIMDRDCENVDRLMQTPAPDWTAYRRKAEIAIRESVETKASPWLLADANALLGGEA